MKPSVTLVFEMSPQQIFYITQGSLAIWSANRNRPREVVCFRDDDDGIRQFADYAAANNHLVSAILVDVIEEEFVHETVPKIGRRDRNTLIARRVERRFRQTPFRFSVCAKKLNDAGKFDVVHSAITNHELVEPWLHSILASEISLTGIYSVPLIAPRVFSRLFKSKNPCMFIAQHQGQRLRQIFMRDGRTLSARLSKLPQAGGPTYAQFIATEVARSRRYMERTRLLLASEEMDVCVVADAATEELLSAAMGAKGDSRVNQLQFVDSKTAAKKLAVGPNADHTRCEYWYINRVAQQGAEHSYAVSAETRFWYMRRFRDALSTTGVVLAAACSVGAALLLTDAWHLSKRIDNTRQQVELLSATYRRENQAYDSIQADSSEMKQAVDAGDYILANRVPVPWVMNQISSVMGRYPDIRLLELRWEAEYPQPPQTAQRRRDVSVPRPMPRLSNVTAVLRAEIVPFRGDMRAAFARIDSLAAEIEQKTNFDRAVAIEYPLNANTNAAISGEIDPKKSTDSASFQLRVRYAVPGSVTSKAETNDEAV